MSVDPSCGTNVETVHLVRKLCEDTYYTIHWEGHMSSDIYVTKGSDRVALCPQHYFWLTLMNLQCAWKTRTWNI